MENKYYVERIHYDSLTNRCNRMTIRNDATGEEISAGYIANDVYTHPGSSNPHDIQRTYNFKVGDRVVTAEKIYKVREIEGELAGNLGDIDKWRPVVITEEGVRLHPDDILGIV